MDEGVRAEMGDEEANTSLKRTAGRSITSAGLLRIGCFTPCEDDGGWLCVAEVEWDEDSCADGERSRRGPGLPLLALSGAAGEAEDGRVCCDLRGAGGLAELERVRVDMADLSRGIDDLALLSDGDAETGSDIAARNTR